MKILCKKQIFDDSERYHHSENKGVANKKFSMSQIKKVQAVVRSHMDRLGLSTQKEAAIDIGLTYGRLNYLLRNNDPRLTQQTLDKIKTWVANYMKKDQPLTTEEMAIKLAIRVADDLQLNNNQVRVQLVKVFKDVTVNIANEFKQYQSLNKVTVN